MKKKSEEAGSKESRRQKAEPKLSVYLETHLQNAWRPRKPYFMKAHGLNTANCYVVPLNKYFREGNAHVNVIDHGNG